MPGLWTVRGERLHFEAFPWNHKRARPADLADNPCRGHAWHGAARPCSAGAPAVGRAPGATVQAANGGDDHRLGLARASGRRPRLSAGVFASGCSECVTARGPGERVPSEPHARSRACRFSAALSVSTAQPSSLVLTLRGAAHSIVAAKRGRKQDAAVSMLLDGTRCPLTTRDLHDLMKPYGSRAADGAQTRCCCPLAPTGHQTRWDQRER